jgi:hypothetical protein
MAYKLSNRRRDLFQKPIWYNLQITFLLFLVYFTYQTKFFNNMQLSNRQNNKKNTTLSEQF